MLVRAPKQLNEIGEKFGNKIRESLTEPDTSSNLFIVLSFVLWEKFPNWLALYNMCWFFFNFIGIDYQVALFRFIISLSVLQVITYRFTEPSCGEMPYYVSNFLMHIQPCIIVECMLQTAQPTIWNGATSKKRSIMLCPECFFRFVW